MQEHHLALPFLDAHRGVVETIELGRERGELVEMRGEQRTATVLFVQMLDRGPGNRKAVEGRRASPDFVENDQRAFAGLIENGGGFHHLDHEGRASAGEIVGGADAREQAIDNAELGAFRRHEAAHLGQNNDERVLAQERRLARHVRPGEQPDAPRACIRRRRKIAIVGDERIADRLFDHGMAAALDDEVERAVDVRANIGRSTASVASPLETSSTASASAAALISLLAAIVAAASLSNISSSRLSARSAALAILASSSPSSVVVNLTCPARVWR